MEKFLSISRSLVSLLFFPFPISITPLSISVILFCCSLALLPFVNYAFLLICCIICLRFYDRLIFYSYLSIHIFNVLLCSFFSELNNIDLLFGLSTSPRIALLNAGYQGLFISICKIKLMLKNDVFSVGDTGILGLNNNPS